MNKEGKYESFIWDFYSSRGENRRNGLQDGKGFGNFVLRKI